MRRSPSFLLPQDSFGMRITFVKCMRGQVTRRGHQRRILRSRPWTASTWLIFGVVGNVAWSRGANLRRITRVGPRVVLPIARSSSFLLCFCFVSGIKLTLDWPLRFCCFPHRILLDDRDGAALRGNQLKLPTSEKPGTRSTRPH